MSFLPVTSVGQAVQAGLLLRGAATVVGSGFRQMLARVTHANPAAEANATDVLPVPAPRPSGAAQRGRLWGQLRELAGELRDRLVSLGLRLPDSVQIDRSGTVQLPDSVSDGELQQKLSSVPSLSSLIDQIAGTVRALNPAAGGVALKLSPDSVDVRLDP